MNAAEALCMARENGVHVGIAGTDLILDADREPAPPVLETLRRHKADIVALLTVAESDWTAEDWQVFYDERAGIAEFDAGVPREWAEGFARLCTMPRHPDFTEEGWQRLIDDAGMFLDRWAVQVAAMGWTTREVFGVGSNNPDARLDLKGFIPLIGGDVVVVVSADSATIQTSTGARQRIFRRPDEHSPGRVPVWEVEGDKQRG